jgi:transcription elongation factor GreA
MNSFPITKKGLLKISETLKHLKQVQRPAIIKQIATARELGDLSENAEYHSAKHEQGLIERNISILENKMANAEVIDITKLSGNRVKFGATVAVLNLDDNKEYTYILAGEYEANTEKNIISIFSPLAKTLIGKEVGDVITFRAPAGEKTYEITSVEFIEFDI